VSDGPYRFVRHPGYAGAVLGYLGLPLLLNSAWAFVPAALLTLVIVFRTALEDQMLQGELAGYAEYARRTPSRLVPGIW
jgi:protein-S-isoprenylcysteine O-methyltransferase Ste14